MGTHPSVPAIYIFMSIYEMTLWLRAYETRRCFQIHNNYRFSDHHHFSSIVESNCPCAKCDCLHYRYGDLSWIGICNLIVITERQWIGQAIQKRVPHRHIQDSRNGVLLQHWSRYKMAGFFLQTPCMSYVKMLYFDTCFTELCSQSTNEQNGSNVLDNAIAPNR